jgi:cell filamentation protein, protein adenylyltransferase
MFCYPESISREAKKLFKQLAEAKHYKGLSSEDLAHKAAHFLAELNAIHPFREGNGRSQLSFLILLAERAGHPFDLAKMDPARIMQAVIASFNGTEKPLADLILGLV